MKYPEFDRIRLDAFREISSIATGNAATSLSALLDRRVDITVPNIMVEALENIPDLLGGCEKTVTAVPFSISGEISGSILLILSSSESLRLVNSQIHIKNRKSKNGYPSFRIKNHQDRSIDCPSWAMDLLIQLKVKSNSNNPYVFITDDRLKLIKKKWAKWQKEGREDKWKNSTMVNNTNRDFVVNCRRAGIVSSDRLSVHCLRKAYGTNLANLSTPVHTLKELMGHSSIATTMKFYIKNNDENSMKAVRGLEGLMEG